MSVVVAFAFFSHLGVGHSLPFPSVIAFALLKPVSASLRLLAVGCWKALRMYSETRMEAEGPPRRSFPDNPCQGFPT